MKKRLLKTKLFDNSPIEYEPNKPNKYGYVQKTITYAFKRIYKPYKCVVVTRYSNGEPVHRLFLQKKSYHLFDITKNKWASCYADGIFDDYHYDSSPAAIGDMKAMDWLDNSDDSVINKFISCLSRIDNAERERRIAKKQAVIDNKMKEFGSIPKGLQKFANKTVFADFNFIFFNKEKESCYCTACEKDFPLNLLETKPKHLGMDKCPKCGKTLQTRNEAIGRKNLVDSRWTHVLESGLDGHEVFTRTFRHIKSFSGDYRNVKADTKELFRSAISKQKTSYYMLADEKWSDFRSNPRPSIFSYPYYYQTAIYGEGKLNEALKDTDFKYFDIDRDLLKYEAERFKFPLDAMIEFYRDFPYMEKLLKVGLHELAFSNRRYGAEFNKDGKNPWDMLCLKRTEYKLFLSLNERTWKHVRIIQNFRNELQREIKQEELEICAEHYWCFASSMFEALHYVSVHKFDRFVKTQKIYAGDYRDYINELRTLGKDMKANVIPKDFAKAHARMSKELQEYQDKKEQERLVLLQKEYEELIQSFDIASREDDFMSVSSPNLVILKPRALDELKTEGEVLNHCVANYREKMAKGETEIYFIRKSDEIEKPFYTMEWKNGKLVQVKGKNNKNAHPFDANRVVDEETTEVSALAAKFHELRNKAFRKEYHLDRSNASIRLMA